MRGATKLGLRIIVCVKTKPDGYAPLLPKLPVEPRFQFLLILLAQQRLHPFQDRRFRRHSGDAVHQLAVLEEEQGRQAHDLILANQLLIFIGIQLDEAGLAFQVVGGGGELGRQHFAGAAPVRPDVHDDGLGMVEYGGSEVFAVDLLWHILAFD